MDFSFEAGLKQYWAENYKYFHEVKEEKDTLDFKALIPFFLIPVVGYALAFILLIIEKLCHHYKNSQKKPKARSKHPQNRLQTSSKNSQISTKKPPKYPRKLLKTPLKRFQSLPNIVRTSQASSKHPP